MIASLSTSIRVIGMEVIGDYCFSFFLKKNILIYLDLWKYI